jgi:hypothetical protein
MKDCGNSTRKIHISNNFILSISLLIMFDTLLLRPSLHCSTTLLHFTTLYPTTHHYTSLHFTQLHFTTLIDTSLPLIYTSLPFHLALHIYISYRSVSHHITTLDTVQISVYLRSKRTKISVEQYKAVLFQIRMSMYVEEMCRITKH